MTEDEFDLLIPEHLRKSINPRVLAEVARRIRDREAAEADNPIYYRRYLEVHLGHIIEEAVRKSKLVGDEDPPD